MVAEGEELEYESDSEGKPLASAMRRREASDDEEGEGSDVEKKTDRAGPTVGIRSDEESDGQGVAPEEDDEDFQSEEYDEEIQEELEKAAQEDLELRDRGGEETDDVAVDLDDEILDTQAIGLDVRRASDELGDYEEKNLGEKSEKKENEPSAVPTAGAFYMHDDRFGEKGDGRHRRTLGGHKLWESKDERAWVHDKFEEMSLQDAHYDEGRRTSKGNFRGHGKNRDVGHLYTKGNMTRAYDDRSRGHDTRSISYDNQTRVLRTVRGRGPRRYESLKNNSEMPATQNKQSRKLRDLTSKATAGRQTSNTSKDQFDSVLLQKQTFASSLSSASPPFYPSEASNQGISTTSKGNTQTGYTNKNHSSSTMDDNFVPSRSGAILRGKTTADSMQQGRLTMDDSNRRIAGKMSVSSQTSSLGYSLSPVNTTRSSGSSLLPINKAQSSQLRVQGRGVNVGGQLIYPQTPSFTVVGGGSAQGHLSVIQQRAVRTQAQPVLPAPSQQLGHHPGSGFRDSSPPQAQSMNLSEVEGTESHPGSGMSKTSLAGKEKTSTRGRSGFQYNGSQVIGANEAMGLPHGDQSFPATPALLPVMQFGGQRRGGLGVPAVGMALPGYVAQPQNGFGNSEMTWVPVLAGAAGALGESYGHYLALDDSYYTCPLGQTSSSSSSSQETSSSKPPSAWKSQQKPEVVNDEFGQRHNKPRRYSEMNFGQ